MALTEYKRKRKFTQTPEPAGAKTVKAVKELRFVVQKHEATRLHFDVRLELDGVMKSWAVPKGPSMNPADKHLAMMVEDHPMEYRTFEGIIPEGNYGAGTVMVWDEGTYTVAGAKNAAEASKLVKAGLKRGDLKFVLDGKKLKGEFVLFRFAKAGDNGWIMMKHKDDAVSSRIVDEDKSVLTGRTMKQITGDADSPQWNNDELKAEPQSDNLPKITKQNYPHAKKAAFPEIPEPMLATLVKEAFDDDDWMFEIKWDGYRTLASIRKGKVELSSRNSNSLNDKFSSVADDLRTLKFDAILDGEVVVLDKQGRSDFQALQNYGRSHDGVLTYCVFDIVYYNGYDLRNVPLAGRKELLKLLIPSGLNLIYSDHVMTQGRQFLKLAAERNLEGIMAKKADSTYQTGIRSKDWLKIKLRSEQELVICGYTKPEGSRQGFGSLILGYYQSGKLVNAGRVGTGFDDAEIEMLMTRFVKLKSPKSPLSGTQRIDTSITWLKPQLVCQVKFAEWTDEGVVRQASYMGLRDDKQAAEVRKELS